MDKWIRALAHRVGHCGLRKDSEGPSGTKVDCGGAAFFQLTAGSAVVVVVLLVTHAACCQEEQCKGCNNARHHGRLQHSNVSW
jgi:hypothetical protein